MTSKIETWTLEELKPRLARAAFVPTLVRVTDDPDYVDDETVLGADDVTAAKIGGAPFLSKEAPAPRCGKCKQPLRFVLQLRRADLPPAAQATLSEELLQLFWCDDCQSEGGSDNAWSKGVLIREVALTEPVAPDPGEDDEDDEDDEALSVTFIRDWQEICDYPSTLVTELAAALEVSPKSAATREKLESLAEAMVDAEIETQAGLKIGGWPRWVSEPAKVQCKCKAAMRPVVQLGEEIAVGDGGTTWLLGCAACGKKAYVCQQ